MLCCILWYVTILLLCPLAIFKAYMMATTGKCQSSRRLDGKTAIVTGSNTGIGRETALDLARRGARVILACRDTFKAEVARREIIVATGSSDLVVMKLDLSRMDSVREFCAKVLENESRLDILVNNAAVAVLHERNITEDGLEVQMATNHFGPFLLTHLLMGLLKKSAPSRIVTLSSIGHKWSKGLEFDNMNAEKVFNSGNIYLNSKLANLIFTRELAERLRGTGVTANSVHPGVVHTELLRNLKFPVKIVVDWVASPFFKSSEEGAQTSIYCAVSDEVEGVSGKYFADCKVTEESLYAKDPAVAKKLWELSEMMCKMKPTECLQAKKE